MHTDTVIRATIRSPCEEYLGVFDCPSDAPLAKEVMGLILHIKPPYMPLQKCPADGSDDITDVLCTDCPG
eukprot:168641-Amphidinium_carterae.1